MLECDVLFFGLGPISHAFVKKLTANGQKVIAVSDTTAATEDNGINSFDLFQTISWFEVLKLEIKSQSTYICWRHSPKNRTLGSELLLWVKSPNLKTHKIHHLSSGSVYRGDQSIFVETDYDYRNGDANFNSKRELEQLVSTISQLKGSKYVNYRISNVYGAGLTRGFIPESIKHLNDDQPIRIYSKLDLIRDYLFIDDLISALFNLRLHECQDEVLNISTGHGVAISEVINLLKRSIVKDLKVLDIEGPLGTLPRSVLSCKKLEETITWEPQPLDMTIGKLVRATD